MQGTSDGILNEFAVGCDTRGDACADILSERFKLWNLFTARFCRIVRGLDNRIRNFARFFCVSFCVAFCGTGTGGFKAVAFFFRRSGRFLCRRLCSVGHAVLALFDTFFPLVCIFFSGAESFLVADFGRAVHLVCPCCADILRRLRCSSDQLRRLVLQVQTVSPRDGDLVEFILVVVQCIDQHLHEVGALRTHAGQIVIKLLREAFAALSCECCHVVGPVRDADYLTRQVVQHLLCCDFLPA